MEERAGYRLWVRGLVCKILCCCGDFRSKAAVFVCAVAKRLVCAFAAATERNRCFALQIKRISCAVEKLEIALNTDRAVVFNGDSCSHDTIEW